MKFWLDDTPRPGWQNMAIDYALLDFVRSGEGAVLRVYRWDPHCLSFGRHEPALRRYGRENVLSRGIDVVRRPTGGRAVWHARELTYSVVQPATGASLKESYRAIHGMLADAVRHLGAPALLAANPPRVPGVGTGACFAQPVGGEVIVSGRKVIGSAQLRENGALLQHGSMLLSDDQSLVRELGGDGLRATGYGLRATGDGPGTTGYGLRATGDGPRATGETTLRMALGRPVSFEEAATAVQDAARAWAPELHPIEDPAGILQIAARHAERFKSDEWTWAR
jgi:lipoate-protein ligase A